MPESYSVNQLKTWNKCQKKYEFDYVRKLLWPANPKNFRLGKGVHQLLDYASRKLPLAPILTSADADIVSVWQILNDSKWAKLPIIASEWGFSLEIQKSWLYGRIDRIAQEDDRIHILDWKTGTGIPYPAQEDWQTLIYLYAVFEAQKELGISIKADQLTFTYVQVNHNALKTVQVPYSTALHEQIQDRLTQTLDIIQATSSFQLPPQCPDRFCPYRKICGIESPEILEELSDPQAENKVKSVVAEEIF